MTTNGHIHGTELGPDALDAVQMLRDHLTVQDDPEIRRQLEDLLRPPEAAPFEVHQWSPDYQFAPRVWLIQDWLPVGRVSMIGGKGGSGKSRLVLQLAAGIAGGGGEGDAWIDAPLGTLRLGNGVPGDGAPVLYASWEDEPEEFFRRLAQISGYEAPWVTPQRLQGMLHVADMVAAGPIWAPEKGAHALTVPDLNEAGRHLRRQAEELGARLLVLDPVAAAYAGDENSRGMVRQFLASWNAWAAATGCAVLLVHHPPKGEEEPYAGNSDWHNGVRALWSLARKRVGAAPKGGRNNPDTRPLAWQLELHKHNYGPEVPPIRLDWQHRPPAEDVPEDAGQLRWKADWWDTPTGDDHGY